MITDLSVIIPCLNEQDTISALLNDLNQQQGLRFELIIADGGSRDNTLKLIDNFTQHSQLSVRVINSPKGRAAQMNLGAKQAKTDDFLFLHADSRINNPHLFADAKKDMLAFRAQKMSNRVAGHFGLRFNRSNNDNPAAYYFYEAKTRMNRLDSINGDQGLWISREYFYALDQFDESLAYMEDARLARKIFRSGQWLALPGCIHTSARRFEVEGLKQRQILNSFLCNFDSIGITEFFDLAGDIYRTQSHAQKLMLKPYLLMIHKMIFSRGVIGTIKIWYQSGGYIVDNAWQLAYALDCRKNRQNGKEPGEGSQSNLINYEKWIAPIITLPPGRLITAVLTFMWFNYLLFVSPSCSPTNSSSAGKT